jgi:hypothetical protein
VFYLRVLRLGIVERMEHCRALLYVVELRSGLAWPSGSSWKHFWDFLTFVLLWDNLVDGPTQTDRRIIGFYGAVSVYCGMNRAYFQLEMFSCFGAEDCFLVVSLSFVGNSRDNIWKLFCSKHKTLRGH